MCTARGNLRALIHTCCICTIYTQHTLLTLIASGNSIFQKNRHDKSYFIEKLYTNHVKAIKLKQNNNNNKKTPPSSATSIRLCLKTETKF